MIQGSPEWHAARLGKVTASRIADVAATVKSGGYGASRANYMAALIAERLTGNAAFSYTNAEMQWGTEKEPEARSAYEFYHDLDVEEVGFIEHPAISLTGASPDGLVGTDGLVEIKCPNTSTHIETLLQNVVPSKYLPQMQWQMACCGRQWCDFVSYDPRLPEQMRLFVRRVTRDNAEIAKLEREVRLFLDDLAAKEAALRNTFMKAAA